MKFFIYKDSKWEWRWRLVARNGRIIATSAEGYKRRSHADHMVEVVRSGAIYATIEE